MASAKSYLRAAQTYIPGVQDVRFGLERRVRRFLKLVHDPDWTGLKQLVLGDGVLLDIGANRGQSIDSFQIVLPGRRLFAFEPNQYLADKLAKEFEDQGDVTIHSVALADRIGEETLYLPRYRNWVFDGLASLEREEAVNWLDGNRLKGFDPKYLTCAEMKISVRKLDEYEFKPAVMKLDTQGVEEQVLRGGTLTIHRWNPAILLESATPSIADFLGRFDYRSYVFDGNRMIPDRLDGKNVFFLRSNHLAGQVQQVLTSKRFPQSSSFFISLSSALSRRA
jgi:FkbM family methyltransferase